MIIGTKEYVYRRKESNITLLPKIKFNLQPSLVLQQLWLCMNLAHVNLHGFFDCIICQVFWWFCQVKYGETWTLSFRNSAVQWVYVTCHIDVLTELHMSCNELYNKNSFTELYRVSSLQNIWDGNEVQTIFPFSASYPYRILALNIISHFEIWTTFYISPTLYHIKIWFYYHHASTPYINRNN